MLHAPVHAIERAVPIADISMEEIRAAYETNVFGPLRVAQAAIPHMAKRHEGLIINMGSIVGEM